jgi:Ca-activated chloride channel homolog
MWRNIIFIAALVPVLLGAQSRPAVNQDQPTFSVAVDLIKVPISIFDEQGALIRDIRRDDFRVYEDGVEQQIRSFGIDRNPLSAVLLLDTSATVGKEMKEIKEAAEEFADALSREDRVSVITFDDQPELRLDWTNDMGQVRKAVRKIRPGMRTALYDAMYMAAAEQLRYEEGRKAIILLTDCLNNQSLVSFEDAAKSVVQSQASLYVVSKTVIVRESARRQRRVQMLTGIYRRLFGDADYIEEFFQKREAEMVGLAEKTGGRCMFPLKYTDIPGLYAEVAAELKSRYYLTYVSNQHKEPDTYHRILVEYLPPHSKLVARNGYFHDPKYLVRRRSGVR